MFPTMDSLIALNLPLHHAPKPILSHPKGKSSEAKNVRLIMQNSIIAPNEQKTLPTDLLTAALINLI